MTATAAEVRAWARGEGMEVPERGVLAQSLYEAYDDAHGGVNGYEGGTGPEDFPAAGMAGGGEGAAAAGEEERPVRPGQGSSGQRRGSRFSFTGRRGRNTGKDKDKGKKDKKPARRGPRLSVSAVIEKAWGQMAWAAGPVPPLARMLYAQAPLAGVILDPVVKDTLVDRVVLQPWARSEERYEAGIGLIGPPVFVMAAMANAPEPVMHGGVPVYDQATDPDSGQPLTDPETGQPVLVPRYEAPSPAYKAAMVGLRWSVGIMVDAAGDAVERVTARAEQNKLREQRVEKFLAFILGYEPPPPEEQPESQADKAAAAVMRLVGADDG